MKSEKSFRPQFSLSTLLGLIVGCCLLFGFQGSFKTTCQMSFHCNAIPEDDVKLTKWFEDLEGVKDVISSRNQNVVTVEFTTIHGYKFFAPPLADFEYVGCKRFESRIWTSSSWFSGASRSILKVPVIAWLGIAVALAILLALRIKRTAVSPSI